MPRVEIDERGEGAMIRWEERDTGDWDGFSGEVIVATVTRSAPSKAQWDWEVTGAGKMKGARNTGHRANEIEAQRAADAFWERWLSKAALKPDLSQALEMSLGPKRTSRESGKRAEGDLAGKDRLH